MIKAINDALEKEEGKKLCPSCRKVNDIQNKHCDKCGLEFSRVSTPEDGMQ